MCFIGLNDKNLMKLRLYLSLFQKFPDTCTSFDYTVFESR